MSGYGRDESAPTPGGMFATNFVGERNIIADRQQHYRNLLAAVGSRFIVPAYTYSPRIRNPLGHIWQSVSSIIAIRSEYIHVMFATCSFSVSYIFAMQKYVFWRVKTPFLHCKNPLFGVQEVGFCKALISRWLHCFCVSGRCSNTINVRNRRYS